MIRPEAYNIRHPMGDSIRLPLGDMKNLIYVQIPKNASCWAKYYLDQLGSRPHNYYDQGFDSAKDVAAVILRDPVERWISGMAQVLVGFGEKHHMHVSNINWDRITRSIFRNNHTQPQHEFIANLPHNRIVWFYCDSTLQHKFIHFLKQYNFDPAILLLELDTENKFNMTNRVPGRLIKPGEPGGNGNSEWTVPPQQDIVDRIRQVLDQHPEYVARLQYLYREDYRLIATANYYDPR
jgi:hypothetical protein